jgi:hypothetical protein
MPEEMPPDQELARKLAQALRGQDPAGTQAATVLAQAGSARPRPGMVAVLLGSLASGLGVAVYFQVSGVEAALTAATWGLFAVIVLWTGSLYLWGTARSGEADVTGLIRSAAGIVITGALTLAFTSLGPGRGHAPLVVRVGIMAIVAGIILAINMYALVLGKDAAGPSALAVGALFSFMCWALAYGLLCIAFSVVLPPP